MTFRYFSVRFLVRCVMRGWFRWTVLHADRVPHSGPVILAANHASFIDPPLIGACLSREIHYLARESLFRFPIFSQFIRCCNAVPVDRDGGSSAGLKSILAQLRAGNGIILFPEGTRTHDGLLQPARSGIGLVVIRSNAPLVPVRVFGTFEAYGRQLRWPRPRPVTVKFGEPLEFKALRAEAKTCSRARLKAIYREVAAETMRTIDRMTPWEDLHQFP